MKPYLCHLLQQQEEAACAQGLRTDAADFATLFREALRT